VQDPLTVCVWPDDVHVRRSRRPGQAGISVSRCERVLETLTLQVLGYERRFVSYDLRWVLNNFEPDCPDQEVTLAMADHRGNVIMLRSPRRLGSGQSEFHDVLCGTVGLLDDLRCCLRQLSPHPGWSAQRWMIASTPFRMRLTSARRRLADLAVVSRTQEQAALQWALEFTDARLEAERRLHDIDACLRTLQCPDTAPRDGARAMEIFVSNRSELLKTLHKIEYLIAQRFPATLGRS
jgi:hypothetical protein